MDIQRLLDGLHTKFPWMREASATAQEAEATVAAKQDLASVENQRQLERDWKTSQRKNIKSLFLNKEKNIAATGRQNADAAKAKSLLSATLTGTGVNK